MSSCFLEFATVDKRLLVILAMFKLLTISVSGTWEPCCSPAGQHGLRVARPQGTQQEWRVGLARRKTPLPGYAPLPVGLSLVSPTPGKRAHAAKFAHVHPAKTLF